MICLKSYFYSSFTARQNAALSEASSVSHPSRRVPGAAEREAARDAERLRERHVLAEEHHRVPAVGERLGRDLGKDTIE